MRAAAAGLPAARGWPRRKVAGMLALAAGSAWGLWRGGSLPPAAAAVVGAPLPAFALPRLDDPGQSLSPADLRGRPWLLNLWASWCAPCRDEHPVLLTLAHERRLPLFGVLHQDDPRAADEWLRRLGDPYRAVAVDREGALARALALEGVPQTLLIDAHGVVRLHVSGALNAGRRIDVLRSQLPPGRGSAP
ncbi:MAG TPA: redoxin family protein [Burkholderiaceae bacterium]|nr:redoxin family protein [Burkholderiaceae bacterium]